MKKRMTLVKYLACFFSLLMFNSIDYFSLGCTLFDVPGIKNAKIKAFSASVFLLTTFVSQLLFGIFTSIRTGITSSIIFEATFYTREIARNCYEETLAKDPGSADDCILGIFICMAMSSLLFSFLSFFIYYKKWGKILKEIPHTAIYSLMSAVGFGILRDTLLPYVSPEIKRENVSILIITVLSAVIIYSVEYAFPDFSFIIPMSAIFIIGAFNFIFRFVMRKSTLDLLEKNLISANDDNDVNLVQFYAFILDGKVVYSCIYRNLGKIVEMAIINLIYLTVNLIPYKLETNVPIDFNNEWFAQGVSNLFSALTGYPSYFVSSTSIFFYKSGALNKLSTLMGAVSPLILALLVPFCSSFIPKILSDILLSYIAFSFINSYFAKFLRFASKEDIVVMIIGVFAQLYNLFLGLILVFAISFFVTMKHYLNDVRIVNGASKRSLSSQHVLADDAKDPGEIKPGEAAESGTNAEPDDGAIQSDAEVRNDITVSDPSIADENGKDIYVVKDDTDLSIVNINYILFFMSLQLLKKDLANVKESVCLDLAGCSYMDVNANMYLLEYSKSVKKLVIVGEPHNFYKWLFLDQSNVQMFKSLIFRPVGDEIIKSNHVENNKPF